MSKSIVAYFSATGTTAALAHRIADAADADVFEIRPTVAYTSADLDWTNKKSRSSVEMADPASRPGIAESCPDLAAYDTIYLGFPIWWYVAPTIVNTFLESGDFAGKKIVPFGTSGSSRMGKTVAALKPSAPGAEFAEGAVLNRASDTQIRSFVEANA